MYTELTHILRWEYKCWEGAWHGGKGRNQRRKTEKERDLSIELQWRRWRPTILVAPSTPNPIRRRLRKTVLSESTLMGSTISSTSATLAPSNKPRNRILLSFFFTFDFDLIRFSSVIQNFLSIQYSYADIELLLLWLLDYLFIQKLIC